MTRARTLAITLCLGSLLVAVPAAARAADATWKAYRNDVCGIELRYPPAYTIDASGPTAFCGVWFRIGVKDAREPGGLRALFTLNVEEMSSGERDLTIKQGRPLSARDFAVQTVMNWCVADGPDGSTHCENGEVRSTFKTAQGFRGWEIYATEVHETFSPQRIEKRRRGPRFALDLSDDETIRVLMADAAPERVAELRSILDTPRVWTKPRRQMPKVVEIPSVFTSPQTFSIVVGADREFVPAPLPPLPVTNIFLLDPRGRQLGRDLATGKFYNDVPAITHGWRRGSGFMLRELVEGRYELQVTAALPSVRYELVVAAPDASGKSSTAHLVGRTSEPGAIDRYDVVYSRTANPAIAVTAVHDLSRLSILVASRGNAASELLLTDPRGRATGIDPIARAEHRKIPRSSYIDEGAGARSMVLDVRQPLDGTYMLRATGTITGAYSLDLRAWDRSGTAMARPEVIDVPTAAGAVHLYRLEYAAIAKTPLKVAGGFNGSAAPTDDANALLAYANPSSVETRLARGVTTFSLVIFYGARIQPVTFNALLNGDNITSRFTPTPDGAQIVPIPLVAGVNTLVLSIDGTTASGAPATDTDRLVFRVE